MDQIIEFDVSCSPLDLSEEVNIYGHIRSVSLDYNSAEHQLLDDENISKEVKHTAVSEYQVVQTEESRSMSCRHSSVQLEDQMSQSQSSNFSSEVEKVGEDGLEFSCESLLHRSKCLKGERAETKNIIKHLQSDIMTRIKLLATVQQLTPEEIALVEVFRNSSKDITSMSTLFANQEFASKFSQYFCSSNFLQKILRSQKSMKAKLILIKYLEKMRKITCGHNHKWKQ